MTQLKSPKTHYELLLKNALGSSDIELIFHEQLPDSQRKPTEARTRSIHAHKIFLHSCDLVKLTFEGDRFAESANGQMNIHLSTDCFNEIDRFLKFCYDGILDVDDSWTPYPHADCLVPLYKFTDYMQCHNLRQVILDYWRTQLENGLAYANIIFHGLEVGDEECIKAANERWPMNRFRCSQMRVISDHNELWLDDGSSALLEALSLLTHHPFSKEKKIISVADEAYIRHVLGEYLAEMTRSARSNIPIDIFADLLTRFIPGTISETDFAALILDYIEDNDITSPFQVQSLLAIVDFSVIPKHQLLNWLLPTIEKFEKLPPLFSSTIKDLALLSGAVKLRCDYSKKVLNIQDRVIFLDCGCVLSEDIALKRIQQKTTKSVCSHPHVHKKTGRQSVKVLREKCNDKTEDSVESAAIRSYFERKEAKKDALRAILHSKEFKKTTSQKIASRKRNLSDILPPKVMRFLDQTATIGEDTYVYIALDEDVDTKFKHVFQKFAKAKKVQYRWKYTFDIPVDVLLKNHLRFGIDDNRTWWSQAPNPRDKEELIAETWNFHNDIMTARWDQRG
ncbi:predicted protein [Chaetoceros tenuissimus]|uniref:BTB domain-containing protein n=1 Tax=Chaetoceros tenuissimus TaxID=426638 RepID=A0AAD3CST1_9STRA|nr:predicted protein [Chaetoceros tenuissimus]